jgi:hypothetical protein
MLHVSSYVHKKPSSGKIRVITKMSKSEYQIKVIFPYEKCKFEIWLVRTDINNALRNLHDSFSFGILISPDDDFLC